MFKPIEPGTTFGHWTTLKRVPKPAHLTGSGAYYLCRCECGKESIVVASKLRNGSSTKCDPCSRSANGTLDGAYKHGHTCINGDYHLTPTYNTWRAMKERCFNIKNIAYKNYGGRGITICDRWVTSFVNFLKDMGIRPVDMTIDREDNDGNYEPSNCRWADVYTQAHNKRRAKVA